MRKCNNQAEFGVRSDTAAVTTCPRHLPDVVSKVGRCVVGPVSSNNDCQVTERLPFGFCSQKGETNERSASH